MEIVRASVSGGGRDATPITSGADVPLDLSAFAGRYVRVTWDQAVYFAMVPATGAFVLSASGAVTFAAKPASGNVVPERVAKDAVTALAVTEFYVHPEFPRMLVKAQSTSATYTEIKVTSDKALI